MSLAFSKIIVPRFNDKVVTGQSVRILAEVASVGILSQLVDPDGIPALSLFYPVGTGIISNRQMTRVSQGLFGYTYDVPITSPLGVYTGSFSATHQGNYARLERVSLFKVMRGSDVELVSYLAWKDQAGVIWYSYVDPLRELVTIDHVPDLFNKEGTQLFTPIPYWVEVLNPVGDLVYIHPSPIGEIISTLVEPAVGFGIDVTETYLWYGEDGFRYIFEVDIANQLIITRVT